jgi:uncharacterized protein
VSAAVGLGDRVTSALDALYDRMRDPAAFALRPEDATTGSLDPLRGHKYGVVVSFRRDGSPVPSPVWLAVDAEGRAYFETGANSAKVKRIRRDGRVLVAASNVRGKPRGPVLLGAGRVLPKEEWPHAEATLAAAFGIGRRVYRSAFPTPEHLEAYVEIRAAG